MPSARRATLALALAGLALPGLAADHPTVQAGQWEFMATEPGTLPQIRRECITADYLARWAQTHLPTPSPCTETAVRQSGTSFVREMHCTDAKGQTETRRSTWTVKSDIYLVHTQERVAADGHTTPVNQLEMVRAGDCPAPAAK